MMDLKKKKNKKNKGKTALVLFMRDGDITPSGVLDVVSPSPPESNALELTAGWFWRRRVVNQPRRVILISGDGMDTLYCNDEGSSMGRSRNGSVVVLIGNSNATIRGSAERQEII